MTVYEIYKNLTYKRNINNSGKVFPNLPEGFFQTFQHGVLVCNSKKIAIFKHDSTYFTYDSHCCNAKGFFVNNDSGKACLVKFEDLIDFLNFIKNKFKLQSEDNFDHSITSI